MTRDEFFLRHPLEHGVTFQVEPGCCVDRQVATIGRGRALRLLVASDEIAAQPIVLSSIAFYSGKPVAYRERVLNWRVVDIEAAHDPDQRVSGFLFELDASAAILPGALWARSYMKAPGPRPVTTGVVELPA